jgi:hypothetical protein
MRTEQLVSMLASGETAVEARALPRRYATALGWAAFGATLIMAIFLGVRPDLSEAAWLPMFWVKLAFPAALLAGALLAAVRLSRPGVPLGGVAVGLCAPVIAIGLLAFVTLIGATPADRGALILGDTWSDCLLNISLLSAPAFGALFWAMKGLAPTRLALSGAACGLLAGAMGALIYALHCPEMAAPFLAVWYLLGMLVPTAAGALLGPRLLRW